MTLARARRSTDAAPRNVPWPGPDADTAVVDTTWGHLQPHAPVPGVETVGELELIELLDGGAELVDTRVTDSRSGTTLPGARHVPHDAIDRLEPTAAVRILFCNGPQCGQTPDALRTLERSGYPLEKLRYYRGGLHDWVTLGLPTEAVADAG